ncbi:MAG TPA: hypothetical protein VMA54_07925 [Steroidobacteraceae bacterium]|nr:hypothetical protein [Steroidobacteraceae bacterium]
MSRQISNAFVRSLSIASAILLVHIGSAAAAAPRSDFQSQVGAVLAGTGAAHAALPANSAGDGATGTKIDAQQFVRELLLGWSASHPARAHSVAQSGSAGNADVRGEDSSAQDDIRSTVQHFLRGE